MSRIYMELGHSSTELHLLLFQNVLASALAYLIVVDIKVNGVRHISVN